MRAASRSRRRLRSGWLSLALWVLAPLLVVVALRSFSLADLWESLSRLTGFQLVVILAANLLIMLVFSGRWWIVLRALGYRVSYLAAAGYRLSASGVSYFTPGPQFGGEPVQVMALARRAGVPTGDAVASVGLERTLEMVVNLAFLATGVILTIRGQVFDARLRFGALLAAGALLLLPVVFLLLLWMDKQPLSGLLARLPWTIRYKDRVRTLWESLRQSETRAGALLRDRPGHILLAVGFTLLSWVGIVGEYGLVTHLMGLRLTLLQLVGILTAARLAFLSPLPGGIGTLEAGQVLIFQWMGLDPAVGLALSLLIRARDILFSGVGLWLGGLWLVESPAQLR